MGPFPRVDRYLAHLPSGYASYPECYTRASVYRTFTESRSLRHFPWERTPPQIAALLRTPVAHEAWLSEVQVLCAVLAMADHHGLDDEQTLQWFRDANGTLLGSRLHRAALSLASPSLMIRVADNRWHTFHRGTGFGMTQDGNSAHVTLRYPPFLYTELVLRGMAEGFRIALSMSRAKNTQVEIVNTTPRSAEYRLTWT